MLAFIEGRQRVVPRLDPGLRFLDRTGEDLLPPGVGVEWLAALDADGLERVDHGLVAFEPRLGLHHPIQGIEEAHIVGNGGVEHDIGCIDEDRRRRIGRL